MKLYFKDEYLGYIQDSTGEGAWVYGTLNPSENIDKYKAFFEALTNEEHEFKENQFDAGWFDESNWFITDDQGNKGGIEIPAVYPDRAINWRWR